MSGASGDIEIFVLSQEFRWTKGSSDKVQIGDDPKSLLDIKTAIGSFKNTERVRDMDHVVLIGLASCEGNSATERRRAEERADQLAEWFGKPDTANQRVYSLSLGQYDGDRCADEELSGQRPIIALGVKGSVATLEEDDIRSVLKKSDWLSVPVRDYSDFDSFKLEEHS